MRCSLFAALVVLATASLAVPTSGHDSGLATVSSVAGVAALEYRAPKDDKDKDKDKDKGKGGKGGDKPAPAAGDLEKLQTSIKDISTNLAAANNTIKGVKTGGLNGITSLSSVNSAVVKLGDSIKTATKVAGTTATLNVTDSATVGTQFLDVQPNIKTLLDSLMSKKSDLDGAAFRIIDTRSLIHDSLTEQQKGASDLGNSFIKALDPSLATTAGPINDQIQGNFSMAIKSFSGRSGVIKIPTALVPQVSQLLDKVGGALGLGGGAKKTVSTDAAGPDGTATNGTVPLDGTDDKALFSITQADVDKLGPDENDMSKVPLPVRAVLKEFNIV